ncbi:MAG: hypothetical protein AB7O56_05785 [Bauldia sp.]
MAAVVRPVPALRVGLVGKRDLGQNGGGLDDQLGTLFGVLAGALHRVPRHRSDGGSPYGDGRARLTLVSGLAEGADQVASVVFLADAVAEADGPERLLGAILPFAEELYCQVSPMTDVARFRGLLRRASFVIELDGLAHGDPPAGDPEGEATRVEAYRAQAEILLRHADILIAIDDPRSDAGGGGTRETTGKALAFGLPVLRLTPGQPGVQILRRPEDADEADATSNWEEGAAALVHELVGPASPPSHGAPGHGHGHSKVDYGASLLTEFFADGQHRRTIRQRLARWFETRFASGAPPRDDRAASPLEAYRVRAGDLNRHYSQLYKGTFLVGYTLAVVAVCLAVLSLIIALRNPEATNPQHGAWWALIGLGLAKLAAVIWIQRSAHSANARRWSERAVDYRYLAEGLRTMTYLPQAGSLRTPEPLSAPFATRILKQSSIDRLLHAIVRQAEAQQVMPPLAGQPIRLDAAAALETIRTRWIGKQIDYHRRNAALMAGMSRWLERAANLLSITVIAVVAIDLLLLLADGLHILPYEVAKAAHKAAPWLLFVAAILPAAVASLNGIRFQSECARLADRSERMIAILEGLLQRADELKARAARPDGRFRIVDAIRLGEDVGRITLDEVAEWSALYAKEMVEP